jgi:hypothetical protein
VCAGLDPSHYQSVGYHLWMNPTNPNSLRLTKDGYQWYVKEVKLKPYDIKIPEDQKIYPRQLLQLERLFEEPYYIKNLTHMIVFGERDAVMLQLHAGNLRDYLNNLEENG